jgi:7-cyano-7-deazaguanine reductase
MPHKLKSLGEGAKTRYEYDAPDPKVLERFPSPFDDMKENPHKVKGSIEISVPEFTSICPVTRQPDFATIKIRYTPKKWCVESKSLKLYLMGFRNFGAFHESCINRICNALVELLNPHSIEVVGEFTPRGGIPFWPTATWEEQP